MAKNYEEETKDEKEFIEEEVDGDVEEITEEEFDNDTEELTEITELTEEEKEKITGGAGLKNYGTFGYRAKSSPFYLPGDIVSRLGTINHVYLESRSTTDITATKMNNKTLKFQNNKKGKGGRIVVYVYGYHGGYNAITEAKIQVNF